MMAYLGGGLDCMLHMQRLSTLQFFHCEFTSEFLLLTDVRDFDIFDFPNASILIQGLLVLNRVYVQ